MELIPILTPLSIVTLLPIKTLSLILTGIDGKLPLLRLITCIP